MGLVRVRVAVTVAVTVTVTVRGLGGDKVSLHCK
jgi:hypothetical protein